MARDRSALLLNKIAVYYQPQDCGRPSGHALPDTYSVTINLADCVADLGISDLGVESTRRFVDSAPACFGADDDVPVNDAQLRALAKQIAEDFWNWRLVAYDRAYNGVVAPATEGLTDSVEWTYVEGDCSTRLRTAPPGREPTTLNHADLADGCDQGPLLDVLTVSAFEGRDGLQYGAGSFRSVRVAATGLAGAPDGHVRWGWNFIGGGSAGSIPSGVRGVVARINGTWRLIGSECGPA